MPAPPSPACGDAIPGPGRTEHMFALKVAVRVEGLLGFGPVRLKASVRSSRFPSKPSSRHWRKVGTTFDAAPQIADAPCHAIGRRCDRRAAGRRSGARRIPEARDARRGRSAAGRRTTSANVRDLLWARASRSRPPSWLRRRRRRPLADGMTVVVSAAPAGSLAAVFTPVIPGSTGVGVWVVDGASQRARARGRLAETSVSASSAGKSPAVSVRVVVSGKVHDVLDQRGHGRRTPLGHGDLARR